MTRDWPEGIHDASSLQALADKGDPWAVATLQSAKFFMLDGTRRTLRNALLRDIAGKLRAEPGDVTMTDARAARIILTVWEARLPLGLPFKGMTEEELMWCTEQGERLRTLGRPISHRQVRRAIAWTSFRGKRPT